MEQVLDLTETDLIGRIRRLQQLRGNASFPGVVEFYDATIELYQELHVELRKRKLSVSASSSKQSILPM